MIKKLSNNWFRCTTKVCEERVCLCLFFLSFSRSKSLSCSIWRASNVVISPISDSNASLPEGISPVDVAALVRGALPEPLTTLELYNEIRGARSSIHAMRNMLKRLPTVNYTTLEFISALLLRVSQKSVLNKARNISLELSRLGLVVHSQILDTRLRFYFLFL